MKKLLFLLLITATVAVKAQTTYTYSYDASGNRTSRTLKLGQTRQVKDEVFKDQIGSQELLLYPNPSKGEVNIRLSNEKTVETAEILVYDVQGKLVLQQKGIDQFKTINLSQQEIGVYIVHLILNGEKTIWKVMKE